MRERQLRLLPLAVTLRWEDPALDPTIAYVLNGADQPGAPTQHLDLEIRGHGRYAIVEDGLDLATVEGVDDVLYVVYRRVHAELVTAMRTADWAHLHAALATVGGVRTLFVGDKEAGKTTLALRLLLDGDAVEGDESVFLRAGSVVAMPRRFHLKPGTETLLPELVPLLPALPFVHGPFGPIRALDPAELGHAWVLRDGPADAVVVLRPRAAVPALATVGTAAVLAEVTAQFLDHAQREEAEVVAAAARFLAGPRLFALTPGPPAATVALLRDRLPA